MSKVTIKTTDPQTGEEMIIAEGVIGQDLIEAEGNYYFMPDALPSHELLKKTERTYTCPYKGLCYYYDLMNEQGDVVKTDATWVYDTPSDGWEMIGGKYGFYAYDQNGILVEVDGEGEGMDSDTMDTIINQGD